MEAQQARLELDPERELVVIPADIALTHARRAIRRLIDRDRAEQPAAAE